MLRSGEVSSYPRPRRVRASILEDVLWKIKHEQISSIAECRNVIDESHIDDADAIGIDLDDQLTLVEEYADDYGFEPIPVDEIRSRVEGHAAALICYIAQGQAREAIEKLEELIDE